MSVNGEKSKTDNNQIVDYLQFYIGLDAAPGYAVFLNGPWGSGKTWFINKFRKEQTEHKFIYVSLYGVQSTSEIEDQFFQQLHPVLASKPFTIGAKILKGALKATLKFDLDGDKQDNMQVSGQISELNVQEFLNNSENRVVIFDDLERCPKLQDLLGYINHFVEHQGQKVILIGDETKIAELEEYQKRSEKLIGRRFTISAEIENALSGFIATVKTEKAKAALHKNSGRILEIYKRSDYRNLRTLRYSVLEYERFFHQLPEKAKDHADFQSDCIDSFFSIAMELRSGMLKSSDIKNLSLQHQKYQVEIASIKKAQAEPNPIAAIYQKHFNLPSQQITPNEESIYFFFEFGSIPAEVIKEAVDNNRYFIQEATPAWVKLWHVFSLTENEFNAYFNEVLKDFKEKKFKIQGELRHVCGLLISLSKHGLININYDKMVQDIDATLEEMISNKEIEPLPYKDEHFQRFDDCYSGLQFSEYKDDAFQKYSTRLKQYQADRYKENIKDSAGQLIPLMKSDTKKVLDLLIYTRGKNEHFYDVPILKHVVPSEFVRALVEMNPKNNARFNVGYVFKERYNLVNHYRKLIEELCWLKNVDSEITKVVISVAQPTKYHLEQLQSSFLVPAIERLDAAQKREDQVSEAE